MADAADSKEVTTTITLRSCNEFRKLKMNLDRYSTRQRSQCLYSRLFRSVHYFWFVLHLESIYWCRH